MDVFLGGALAILATLLGQVTSHVLARRNAVAASDTARLEALRRERIAAYSDFAGALSTYRRSTMDRAFTTIRQAPDGTLDAARRDARRDRDVAQRALFLVELVSDSTEVVDAARDAFASMDAFAGPSTRAATDEARDLTRQEIRRFVEVARTAVGDGPAGTTARVR